MEHLRVCTFNIQHGRTPEGAVDVDLVARVATELDVHLLGLQEVDVGAARSGHADTARTVAEACGHSWAFAPALALGSGGQYGNALCAAGRIGEVEALALPGRPGGEPRIALLAQVTLDRAPRAGLSVACTHLSTRSEQGRRQLAAVLDALEHRPPPRLLLGDLNSTPREVRRLLAGRHLRLVGGPRTFPAGRPRRRIDHVAVQGLAPLHVEAPAVPVSDHRPLVVTLGTTGASFT